MISCFSCAVNTLVSFVASPCFLLAALLRLPLVHRPASPPQAFYTRPGQLLAGSLEETEKNRSLLWETSPKCGNDHHYFGF